MAGRNTKRINTRGIQLRRSFEQRALARMIERLEERDEAVDSLCKMMHVYCELIRQDAATDKMRASSPSAPTEPADGSAPSPADRAAREARLKATVAELYGLDPALPARGEQADRTGRTAKAVVNQPGINTK